MDRIVNIHEAKTHLSRLLEQVRRGRTVTIAKAGVPVAMLVPVGQAPRAGKVRGRTLAPVEPVIERRERLRRLLEQEIWPQVPETELGRRLTRDEEDVILGFGPGGV